MSKVLQFLGESFINKDDETLELSSIRGKGKVIAVYFSAHWCPPCRNFTPKLAKFYNSVKAGNYGSQFELIFISSDKNDAEFKEYLNEMPWWAMPYDKRNEKAKLSKHFKISGIPTLIFLDGETGKVINKNGRAAVDNDQHGTKFPWKAKTLHDMLKEGEYVNNQGEKKSFEQDIRGKILGIYFSAHWCPPCKSFTPMLCETYTAVNGNQKRFEVIFVSSDQDEKSFNEYFAEMPFLALPYDSELKEELGDYFEVEGIPMLVILDREGNVITSSGRSVVSGDVKGEKFPWKPEPVEELNDVSGPKINDETCLIYNSAGDNNACERMKTLLKPLGEESQALAKAEGRNPDLYFFVTTESGETIVESLCEFLDLKKDDKSLFIVDVPSGLIYKSETAEPTKDEIEKFVKDYRDDKLKAEKINHD